MYIDFCVIVIQPINIGEKERQGMTFTTTARAKDLNGLRFKFSFSYNRYEKITKLKTLLLSLCIQKKYFIIKVINNVYHLNKLR